MSGHISEADYVAADDALLSNLDAFSDWLYGECVRQDGVQSAHLVRQIPLPGAAPCFEAWSVPQLVHALLTARAEVLPAIRGALVNHYLDDHGETAFGYASRFSDARAEAARERMAA